MKYWISLFTGILAFGLAHTAENVRTPSRDALYAYYDKPYVGTPLRVTTKREELNVEVCADLCDLFSVPVKAGASEQFWDMILLFKSFISTSMADETFRNENSQLAEGILIRMSSIENCDHKKDNKSKALCVIRKYASRTDFAHAEVVYDEGNRCLAYRSFDEQQTLVKARSRCTRVRKGTVK